MKLNARYFGMIAEWIGETGQLIEFSGSTVAELRAESESRCGSLKNISYQVAVNQKMAPEEQELNEMDEVAFLPPFAGG